MNSRWFRYGIRCLVAGLGLLTIGMSIFLFGYIFVKGRTVMSLSFLLERPSGIPLGTDGGIFPALVGSVYSGLIAALIGGVLGIGTAVYQTFYAREGLYGRILRVAIYGLSGIPSILFGLIAYTLLIYRLGIPRSLISASIAVGVMIIPFVAIRAEKIFLEKGKMYMEQSLCLGLSREYALGKLILPACFAPLLNTVALAMAYGMGAVAPILYTGAVMQAGIPKKLTDPFMSLPYHLYMLVSNGYSMEYAYGTALVLLGFLLTVHFLCKAVAYFREGAGWKIRRK